VNGTPLERYQGRVAIITGASRGIGLDIAERLVAEGTRVCITARKKAALDDAIEALGGPEHAIAVEGSSDDSDHQAQTVARTLEALAGSTSW